MDRLDEEEDARVPTFLTYRFDKDKLKRLAYEHRNETLRRMAG